MEKSRCTKIGSTIPFCFLTKPSPSKIIPMPHCFSAVSGHHHLKILRIPFLSQPLFADRPSFSFNGACGRVYLRPISTASPSKSKKQDAEISVTLLLAQAYHHPPHHLFMGLCSLSYFIGSWSNTPFSTHSSSSSSSSHLPCHESSASQTHTNAALDFSAHHYNDSSPSAAVGDYPACHVSYSEYTPCEDRSRSLKYSRERLVYRERHCPEMEEDRLKCLVPAPYGYRIPFPWPASRDFAWLANVPHKELTVEKAGQNWVRVEGDRFRFPGGGTMFRLGADAYIDEIAALIPLADGSIRTAIDTGCGASCFSLSLSFPFPFSFPFLLVSVVSGGPGRASTWPGG